METMNCKICGGTAEAVFKKRILKKYDVTYYQCKECAFLFTEEPYWLEEAYSEALSIIDTGVMQRNVQIAKKINIMLKTLFHTEDGLDKKVFLDYGGGYGIFTRMMRDLGYHWLWFDKYADNLVAKGFEYKGDEQIFLVTAFEVFEHFTSPMEEIEKMLNISQTIIFSTLLYDDGFDFQKKGDWWYYAPDSGQHISFYSKLTLEKISELYHLRYYKINDDMHVITKYNLKKMDLFKYKLLHKYFKNFLYDRQTRHSLATSDMKEMTERKKA